MAEKSLRVINANGEEKQISVLDTTTVREILERCHEAWFCELLVIFGHFGPY